MDDPPHTIFDWSRKNRTGLPEVVFAENKRQAQLDNIIDLHRERNEPLLLTRLTVEQQSCLEGQGLTVDPIARTAVLGKVSESQSTGLVAIVAAGTSDLPVAKEACNCAEFFGLGTSLHVDVGVAGLWRLEAALPEISEADLIIAVAGMEGALFSVLAGLVSCPVIAVPTSVGYGVSGFGNAALSSALASCSPGIVTVNVDNGFGAAAAAAKWLLRSQKPM